jgi:potassium channel subfamily K protein
MDDEEDEEEEEEEERVSVPLTITMAVIGFYIFMGALLFGVWEKWEALDASYFCFVTVSTIGFGDIVPGSANFETKEDQYKMIVIAIYMLFGLALLSMCFSLIQEEIATKFKWVGEKLGIIGKEQDIDGDEDEDEDEEEIVHGHRDHDNDSLPPKPGKN